MGDFLLRKLQLFQMKKKKQQKKSEHLRKKLDFLMTQTPIREKREHPNIEIKE